MKHRWNTNHYEKYTSKLWRTDLNKLYPSESWVLYRTALKSKNCLDIGCGNGAMSQIIKKINQRCKYVGVDHQENLIKNANKIFKSSKFIFSDVNNFILSHKKKYDLVMAWSVIKSFENWRQIIDFMIQSSKKYVVFDQRVTNFKGIYFDKKILQATYGNISGPLLCIDYKSLKKHLYKYKDKISKIEIMAYKSDWGRNVKFYKNSTTYVATFLIQLKTKKEKKNEIEIYEQLPLCLKK